jgi:hypothetical protein
VSKSRGRKSTDETSPAAAAPVAPPNGGLQILMGLDPKAPTEPIDVQSSKEGWSEYILTDGSVIRTKAAILDVKRVIDQYSPEGDPIYVMQFAFVNQLRVPPSLKKKG